MSCILWPRNLWSRWNDKKAETAAAWILELHSCLCDHGEHTKRPGKAEVEVRNNPTSADLSLMEEPFGFSDIPPCTLHRYKASSAGDTIQGREWHFPETALSQKHRQYPKTHLKYLNQQLFSWLNSLNKKGYFQNSFRYRCVLTTGSKKNHKNLEGWYKLSRCEISTCL